jgi:hypothetical protein
MKLLLLFSLLLVFLLVNDARGSYPPENAPFCVQNINGQWTFVVNDQKGNCFGAPASGWYNETKNTTGWNVLEIVTNEYHSDPFQAYAAGFFEGWITAHDCLDFYANQIASTAFSPELISYLDNNAAWVLQQLADPLNLLDPYWVQAGLMADQFSGMLDGINARLGSGSPRWNATMLILLSSQGDLCDLTAAYPAASNPRRNAWRGMEKDEFEEWLVRNTHCSSIVKVPQSQDDIFFAHATWQSFTFALRIFKTLTFNYKGVSMQTIQFSSYPGAFVSTDDFHVLDSGLVVMETSLSVFNTSIYSALSTNNSLLSWMRVMIANRLASSPAEWSTIFSRYNSGTYNNQWMVLDINQANKAKHLPPNTLYVVEQMPGAVRSADVTHMLANGGYWPSYNVPYFVDLFDLAGYPEAIKQQGPNMLSYDGCVRAKIFAKRQGNVHTIEDLKFLMQYNDFQHDPLSLGNPVYAIAARGDIKSANHTHPSTFGGIDAKVGSANDYWSNRRVFAWSGPTPQQPIFSFANTTAAISGPHIGVPTSFNFGFQEMIPNSGSHRAPKS